MVVSQAKKNASGVSVQEYLVYPPINEVFTALSYEIRKVHNNAVSE